MHIVVPVLNACEFNDKSVSEAILVHVNGGGVKSASMPERIKCHKCDDFT